MAVAFLALRAAADPSSQPRVCLDDADDALRQAERFHELGTKDLMAARGVAWSGIELRDIGPRAARYVARRKGESLILYARDDRNLCAFMWFHDGGGISRRYERIADGADRLRQLGEELRTVIATGIAASGRAPTRQAVGVDDDDETALQRPFAEIARELSALLFPSEFHAMLDRTATLSIIPVGTISTIPLAAIEPLNDGRQTLDMFSLNILALAEDVDAEVYGWVPGFRKPLILGDPAVNLPGWAMPALPGAAREAQFAYAQFGGMLRLAEQATKDALYKHAPDAELVIIAAHGVSNPDDPIDGSFLALSDGPLTPREIMQMKLAGHPLVVLSACQSGLGQSMDAGVIGLARGFQIAGATNTVMSLWNVDDAATEYQMSRFYENLRSMTPAAALRAAALAARAKHPDPMKWAAFQIFGVSTVLVTPP